MRIESIRRALHQVVTDGEADLRCCRRHLRVEPLRIFPGPKFAAAVDLTVEPFGRQMGVQLK
ncbi:MAG TPA: hypothetical protein VNW89_05460, partial [Stellaceae bacterium]|nr:hypothetical protein [Stellaceae bacterium]